MVATFAMTSSASARSVLLEGKTSSGTAVRLTVGDFGNATRFRISSYDVACDHGTMSQKAISRTRFDRSDPGRFRDDSNMSFKAGAITFKTSLRIRGELAGNERSWRGTYKAVTELYETGAHIDTCRLRTTWRVGS